MYHDPVLRDEAVELLLGYSGRTYVDGTLGGGGHAEEICRRMDQEATLICFDADEDAIRFASERLVVFRERIVFVHSNFRHIKSELHSRSVHSIDGLLLDLGVSSFQLDDGSKGFSFRSDEAIDMRMDRRQRLSGWDVVNSFAEEELADVLWKYGEERNSRRLARAIVRGRPVDTTGALRSIVQSVTGERFATKSLARVFQAIRIRVNNELDNLQNALNDAVDILAPGGRLVVISYHSLEDRIVKDLFREKAATMIPSGHKYVPDTAVTPKLTLLTKKPLTATAAEEKRNPRSRSAKLRAAERVE